MSRVSSICCISLLAGSIFSTFGCSGATTTTPAPHSGISSSAVRRQSTGHWTTVAPMPTARYDLASGVLNGKLYAIGGVGSDNIPVNTVEAYDPTTNTWSSKAPMPKARWAFAACVVNGILYAIGGLDVNHNPVHAVEAYDPTTDTWSKKAAIPTPRYWLGAGDAGGKIFAVGGNS